MNLNQRAQGRREFHQVMNFYPTVLRHLGIEVPVHIEATGPRANEIKSRLELSPRLSMEKNAELRVQIEDTEGMIAICLHGKKLYGCGVLRNQELKDADDPIASVIDSFHNTVFSPRIELTQSDINSLDGRSVRQDAKSAIDSLLGKKKKRRQNK